MRAIELRAESLERARVAAEERAARLRREWEAAMERAKAEFGEAFLAQALDSQLAAWTRAEHLGRYLEALRGVVDRISDPSKEADARRWLAWANAQRDQLDPLNATIGVPRVPEPTPEQLRPFLRGHDPYGPPRW